MRRALLTSAAFLALTACGGLGFRSADAAFIYFSRALNQGLSRLKKSGGEPELLVPNGKLPWRLAVDDTGVWWGDHVLGGMFVTRK